MPLATVTSAAALTARLSRLGYHRCMNRPPRDELDALPRALGPAFFNRQPDVVARDLLGCLLVVETSEGDSGGLIVETEAYLGSDDPGSHAATRGVTRRNAVMYGPPGTVYVYFTYGCHNMLNLVCCSEGTAGAVLVRAIQPGMGLDVMRARRPGKRDRELCSGPGKLAAALGVELADNGTVLGEGRITVYDVRKGESRAIGTSGRVGLRRGHELELRFFVVDNDFVSRGRTGPPQAGGTSVEKGRP